MKIRFGKETLEFPSQVMTELRESQALLGDIAALKQRMAEDGYVFMRGLLDRSKVLQARETILKHIQIFEVKNGEI